MQQADIRNIAIIAHVDHGKTTLVDAFIKQSQLFRDNQQEMKQTQILDSNELEREKGITILAKNIAIDYKGYKINIIDTPGHSDFGGEVERTLNMADGCILVVDAQEGVMPQTEFVLRKAFELNLPVIVVINKIDKKFADVISTRKKVEDLFLNLATSDTQLSFPVFYAIGREGKVFENLPEGDLTVPDVTQGTIQPLLDKIIEYIPKPQGDINGSFQMQVAALDYDSHVGRYLIGRVNRGKAKIGQTLILCKPEDSNLSSGKVTKIFVRKGLNYESTDIAETGDIVAITGIESTEIGATLCDFQTPEPLSLIKISPPSVKIKIEPNTSPFTGKDGDYVTAKQIEQRIEREKETNISLKIEKAQGSSYYISGRGELQLSILIETLRREGYEFQVRRPEVILQEEDGLIKEPVEKLYIDVPEEWIGIITNELGHRKAILQSMETSKGIVHFIYQIKTRNLLGLRNTLLTQTKGTSVLNSFVSGYEPLEKIDEIKRGGVLIAYEKGISTDYALGLAQDRGDLFIKPGEPVYEGMIVGINKFDTDLDINIAKEREVSSRMRVGEVTQIPLKQTLPLTLEYALVFIADDEMLEVTPQSLRLRKVLLTRTERTKAKRQIGNIK
ncbi:GTP-binding protein [Candidatus Dojkabacteria bacterium]|nr:GTP-binding protein [Candidatus Dojkabacteria bacterium]